MSNKGPKLPKAPRKSNKAESNKRKISPLALILAVATLLGGLAAATTFLPRLTVTISDPPDPDNTFSALATVTNTGYIPLRAVTINMGLGEMCTQGAKNCVAKEFPNPKRDYLTRYERVGWIQHDMAIDDHFTFALDDVMRAQAPGGLVYADIAIIIDYEIVPYIHWKREKVFPLYTHKVSNGKLYWQWK